MRIDVQPRRPGGPRRSGPRRVVARVSEGPDRGPLRRYLEARGVLGGFARPHAGVRLTAVDGTPLRASYLPGPADAEVAVVCVHGFGANRRKPAYARLADGLSLRTPVLALDLRGHGASGGRSTLGDREVHDVLAAVRWLQRFGHRRVVALGASMGGTAVLGAAATRDAEVAGVVTVSAPAYHRDPPDAVPLQRLHRIWQSPRRRAVLKLGLGIDLAGPEDWSSPPDPVEVVAGVRAPLLVVHGRDDAYFPPSDAQALVAAAAGPAVRWDEPDGFGHAEDGFRPELVRALSAAIAALPGTGRFPARAPAPPHP
jgi:pimeloyl-ACP methyl ester carboxylesterase